MARYPLEGKLFQTRRLRPTKIQSLFVYLFQWHRYLVMKTLSLLLTAVGLLISPISFAQIDQEDLDSTCSGVKEQDIGSFDFDFYIWATMTGISPKNATVLSSRPKYIDQSEQCTTHRDQLRSLATDYLLKQSPANDCKLVETCPLNIDCLEQSFVVVGPKRTETYTKRADR
jgi:hypothetical protein